MLDDGPLWRVKMRILAGGVAILLLSALLGCSDDNGNGKTDGPQQVSDGPQQVSDGPQQVSDGPQQTTDGPQQTSDVGLPPDLQAWCVGTTSKFRIGTQDQNWAGMDAPGQVTGTVMTIEPQFTVGGVKHSFYLTVNYTKTYISPIKVDLANLAAGESVKKNGATGPIVPADKRKGIVEIVASGGGFELYVCAWVDGESWYFPGMPMA
jgi:hypothetical protein